MVEADFQRFYGMDLREQVDLIDASGGQMTLRRMHALVAGLPVDAVTWRFKAWTQAEEFGALLLERLDVWGQTFVGLLTGRRVEMPPTITIRRPGDDGPKQIVMPGEPEPRRNDPVAIAKWFGQLGRRR